MQTAKIDVTKINKSAIYVGEKGKYITITFMENRDGADQYGNDGFVTQDIGKERRLAGEKGPILGNWKHVGQKPTPRPQQRSMPPAPAMAAMDDSLDDGDDIPF